MSVTIRSLTVEYRDRPTGIDALHPRLGWVAEAVMEEGASARAETASRKQSAYRILVGSSRERLQNDQGDLWDTGKAAGDQSIHIRYGGLPLVSARTYYWKVMVWDQLDAPSAWSDVGSWSMGLLDPGEWSGEWIGRTVPAQQELPPSPYLRKTFRLKRDMARATVYATALGVYELHVNGARVGDAYFAPGWTDYAKRVQYQAYDVTDRLQEGDNAVGAILGTGWYAGQVGMMDRATYGVSPCLLLQIIVEYRDGSRDTICTDSSWRMATGGIVYSDMIKGESYDLRLLEPGWDEAPFDDASWRPVEVFPPYAGQLVAQVDPPIRVTERLQPIGMRRTAAGTCIYDMGQNMVGWVELVASGAAGTEIAVSYAEMLNPDGTLYTDNLRKAVQRNSYVLAGSGAERLQPHFTFHGFRYVEVSGYPGEAGPETITGHVVHSDIAPAGRYETSDAMINRLFSNISWGQRGNYISVPTDCPQRDERLGWTGDAQIFIRTGAYNRNVANFFKKYMHDIADAQRRDGAFPDVAPDAGWHEWKMRDKLKWYAPDNAGWGDAGVIIPWTVYLMYGDTDILQAHYTAMRRWIDYCERLTVGLIRPGYANYADWLAVGGPDTPKDVLSTQYFAYSASLFARIAGILGHSEDASRYADLYGRINQAFNERFVREDGRIEGDTQTVYVLALYFGMVAGARKDAAAARLGKLIRANGNRLTTGFLGVGYLLPVLSDHGMDDLAYALLHQEEFPSWLYSVKHGATTIWERWDGWTEENGFQTPSMNSFNHYSLGSVGEWMYRYSAGIDSDPTRPGFKHIVLRPRAGGKLTFVRASYESMYGLIESHWRDEGEFRIYEAAIPFNTTATMILPDPAIEVSGSAISPEADAFEAVNGEYRYRLAAGRYLFRTRRKAEE